MSSAWPFVTWRDSARELPDGIDRIPFDMVASSLPWTRRNRTAYEGYRWATLDDIEQDSIVTKDFLKRYRQLTIDHEHCRTAVLFEGRMEGEPLVYATFDEYPDAPSNAVPRRTSWMGKGFEDWMFHDDTYALSVDTIHDMIEYDATFTTPVGYEGAIGVDDVRGTRNLTAYVNLLHEGTVARIGDRTWILVQSDLSGQEWQEPVSGSTLDSGILVLLFNEASRRGAASLEGLTEAQKELIRLNGRPLQLSWWG